MPRLFYKLSLLSFFSLAACESDEERAVRFYQSGLTLLEAGSVDLALVEFRNVMAADPRHTAARLAYADAQRALGAVADAYGQYIRLVEQDPDDATALIALSEISTLGAKWEDAENYGRAAAALRPTDPAVMAVTAMLDYRKAVMAKNDTARAAAAVIARQVLQNKPDNVIARRLVIDNNILNGDVSAALNHVSAGLTIDPAQIELYIIRIGLLSGSGDTARAQAALEDMAAQFPDNLDVRQNLIAWYMGQDDLPAAEIYLRSLAASPDGGLDQRITVVDFLRQTQGPDSALAELNQMIADDVNNRRYRALRASIYFAQDRQDTAIAEMRDIIATDTASDATRDFKIVLAQMLSTQGDVPDARVIVAQVLADDAGHVEALKMSAQWAIADDDPNAAIITLRQALAQAPRDISLITLLGTAHARAGDHDLAGERYALSVEISGQAAGPSLRYAGFLLDRNRIDAAETVVVNALAVAPQDIELLAVMAEIQMRQSAWNQVTRIVWKLRAMNTLVATGVADGIQIELLKRQDRYAETMVLLQDMIADGATSMAATAQLVEVQVRAGRLDDARAVVRDQLAEQPDDPTLRFLQAGILTLAEDLPAAEAVYRALLGDVPDNEQVFRNLYVLLMLQEREDEATTLLEQALTSNPTALAANMIQAGRLEAQGDFDRAIAIYEALYAQDSDNPVVTNNLASMISARRDNADDLARAATIAARLRGSDVPQFQDTLGWIAYRRGNYLEALSYLEPAARGLPDDALTHFHLGMTFAALDRTRDARAALTQAVKLGENTGLAQVDAARDALAKLPQ